VDDHQFAETWVENRLEFRPRSRRALAVELRQKGIASEIIDDVLCDIDDDEIAHHLAQKQAHKYQQSDWQEFYRKMSAYLARRGFYYRTITPIVKQIWSELETNSVGQSD
jgi:regulatory protein